MTIRHLTVARLLVASAVLAATSTSCTDTASNATPTTSPTSTTTPAPTTRIGKVAAATRASGSYRLALSATTTVNGTSKTVTGKGGFSKGSSSLVLDLTPDEGGASISFVTTATSTYVRYLGMEPSVIAAMGMPNGWIELEGATTAAVINSVATGVDTILTAFDHPVAPVEDLGHETIDGRATTHLRATVDLGAVDRGLTIAHAQARELVAQQAAAAAKVPAEIWFDDADRLVRVTYTESRASSSTAVTLTFSDDGQGPSVKIPDSATRFTLDQYFTATLGPDHSNDPPVDTSALPLTRDQFIQKFTAANPAFPATIVGCVYDQLTRSPDVLRSAAANATPTPAEQKVVAQALAFCSVTSNG